MSIRASMSAREITPEGDAVLLGYTGSKRMSSGVRDPLYASAVHLRGGSGGIIVLSLDLLSLDPSTVRDIRRRVCEATGTPETHVFVGTTQTHSAPAASRPLYQLGDPSYMEPSGEYLDFVVEEAVQAASESAVTSRPAAVATIELDAPHTGALLIKGSVTGRIIALVIVGDEIPNRLGPGNTEVSSDFLGATRARLAKRFGGSPVVVYFAAASGDRRLHGDSNGSDGRDAAAVGTALADRIVEKVKGLKPGDFKSNIAFGGRFADVAGLPRKPLPSDQEAVVLWATAVQLNSQLDRDSASPEEIEAVRWGLLEAGCTRNLVMAEKQGLLHSALSDYEPAQVHLMWIGGVKLLGIPGRLRADCGRQIAERAGGNVWIAECVNGDLQGGILADHEGSCRLMSALYAPEAGDMLANAAVLLASAVR